MTDYFNQEKIKRITSPNGQFICLLQEENRIMQKSWERQKIWLYRVANSDLIHLKTLFGDGIFLDDTTLLIFIDNSGYGPCEGDCYLYEISSDKICPLYDDNFDSLRNEYNKIGSRGDFVSLSSNILVTPNFLIFKPLSDEIFFYNRKEILSSRKLELIYRLSPLTDNEKPVEELLGFSEQTKTLEYSSEGIIKRKEIDFKQTYSIGREIIGLNISSELYKGCAMDFNTVLSSIKPDGTIETQKSELGEYMYQLKYNLNESVSIKIAQKIKSEYFHEFPAIGLPLETSPQSRTGFVLYGFYGIEEIDILIPIPSSNPEKKDPLEDLWIKISQLTRIPIDTKYLIKTKVTPQIKSIDDRKKREYILMNSLSVVDNRYQDKNVLLLDDTYCSGSTLNVASTIIKERGKVKQIYALTILKIRSDSKVSSKCQTMNRFTIQTNAFLKQVIQGFYHSDYSGGGQWRVQGTIENIICTLKNDITPYPQNILLNASQQLANILSADLTQILRQSGKGNLTVCVIPRAKVNYNANQLLFKATVGNVISRLNGFSNGTNYITRHTDTKTTHLSRGVSGGGNGSSPYPGITNDTCTISNNVRDKDILLIDDLYTKTVNVDEDAIQSLLDKGAKSVIFYAVGNTKSRSADTPPNFSASDADDLPF